MPRAKLALFRPAMEELLAHMRGRVAQLRKVMSLAHDPRMIEMIQKIIDEGEADIAKIEAERAMTLPPQIDHQA